MNSSMDRRVRNLIDETSDAYAKYGVNNADYAAFASMALSDFKALLGRPELTGHQLRRILRQGDQQHRSMQVSSTSWSIFMAQYVRKNLSANDETQSA